MLYRAIGNVLHVVPLGVPSTMLRPLSELHDTRRRQLRRATKPETAKLAESEPRWVRPPATGPGRCPQVRTYAQAFGAWRRLGYWWYRDRAGLACLCPSTAAFVGHLMASKPPEIAA